MVVEKGALIRSVPTLRASICLRGCDIGPNCYIRPRPAWVRVRVGAFGRDKELHHYVQDPRSHHNCMGTASLERGVTGGTKVANLALMIRPSGSPIEENS